jgi:hypothetical protein
MAVLILCLGRMMRSANFETAFVYKICSIASHACRAAAMRRIVASAIAHFFHLYTNEFTGPSIVSSWTAPPGKFRRNG